MDLAGVATGRVQLVTAVGNALLPFLTELERCEARRPDGANPTGFATVHGARSVAFAAAF